MFSTQRFRPRRAAAGLAVSLALVSGSWLNSSVALADSGTRFLVIGGTASPSISVLGLDDAGRLSTVPGSPFASGTGSLAVTVTPDGRYVYSTNTVSGTVNGFRLGGDGVLTPIPEANLELGAPGVGAVVAPDGKRLYVTSGSVTNEIRTYSITATGGLVFTGTVQVPGVSGLSQMAISPDGRFVFAVGWLQATTFSFAVGPDGALTLVDSIGSGLMSTLPGVTPDGRFLYVSDEASGTISGYAIGTDGQLNPVPGSPFSTGLMSLPHAAQFTADSRRMYIAEAMAGKIGGYEIAENGALIPLPGAPYPTPAGTLPGRVVVDSESQRLFLIDTLTVGITARVHPYAMAPDGRLTRTGEESVDTGLIFADGANAVVAVQQ